MRRNLLSATHKPEATQRSRWSPGLQNEINGLLDQINALNAQVAALEAAASAPALVWINHTALLSGNTTDLTTSFNSTSSGVGGGLAGLVIQSATTGSTFPDGGNKVVWRALEVPPRFVKGRTG